MFMFMFMKTSWREREPRNGSIESIESIEFLQQQPMAMTIDDGVFGLFAVSIDAIECNQRTVDRWIGGLMDGAKRGKT